MTKRIIAFMVSLMMLASLFTMISCNGFTPFNAWSNAMKQIKSAEFVSAEFSVKYGDSEIGIDARHNLKLGSRRLSITLPDEKIYDIYSDGDKNYYKENDDIMYSSDMSSDSEIMREFLSFRLLNAETIGFDKNTFSSAELVETDGGSYNLTFTLSGTKFKSAFAPDEDITFGENINMSASFSSEKKLTLITLSGNVSGAEFYGIPLYLPGNQNFEVVIDKIDYSSPASDIAPEKTGEYPDLPAFAKINASLNMISLKKESSVTGTVDIAIKMTGMSLNIPMTMSSVIAFDDSGNLTTRTVVDSDSALMNNIRSDIFTDGKSNYIYYTAEDGESFKTENTEDVGGDIYDMDQYVDLINDSEIRNTIFADSVIQKKGKETEITIPVSNEIFIKAMDGMNDSQLPIDGISINDMNITLILDENDLIKTGKIECSINMPLDFTGTGDAIKGEITLSVEFTMSDFSEDIKPDIPEGYENYPLSSDEIIY